MLCKNIGRYCTLYCESAGRAFSGVLAGADAETCTLVTTTGDNGYHENCGGHSHGNCHENRRYDGHRRSRCGAPDEHCPGGHGHTLTFNTDKIICVSTPAW